MKAEDLIMKADASPEEVVADGEGLGKNVNVVSAYAFRVEDWWYDISIYYLCIF